MSLMNSFIMQMFVPKNNKRKRTPISSPASFNTTALRDLASEDNTTDESMVSLNALTGSPDSGRTYNSNDYIEWLNTNQLDDNFNNYARWTGGDIAYDGNNHGKWATDSNLYEHRRETFFKNLPEQYVPTNPPVQSPSTKGFHIKNMLLK